MTILLTGATGFVGRAIYAELQRRGSDVRVAVRPDKNRLSVADEVMMGPINATTDWSGALLGVDAVLHLAARVHVMRERALDPLAEFRAVNTAGSLNLAEQAAQAGVKRLVFISSLKVNGAYSSPGKPFRESDVPVPDDAYAVSKYEAEVGLRKIAHATGLEVTVIRPPLVYGPGVRANFQSLMRAVQRGWPLPFGAISNCRSLVGLDNLVDFVLACSTHPKAGNQTFFVSDGQDLSTPELVLRLANALQVRPHLLRVPVSALQAAGALLGRKQAVARLCGSLQADTAHARQLLGWVAPVSVDTGLQRACAAFIKP